MSDQTALIRPPVFATTSCLTASQPMASTIARTGMPKTTTMKPVLCQKYGEACQPETRHPDEHQGEEGQPDVARSTESPGAWNLLAGITPG